MIDWKRTSCVVLVAGALSNACAPMAYKAGTRSIEPSITDNKLITTDGVQLPIRKWIPKKGDLKAVLLVVQGFNEYSNYFTPPGDW